MFKFNSYEHKTYAWGCEEGAQAEREHIIALLTDYIPDPHEEGESCDDCELIRDLIALIKGETVPISQDHDSPAISEYHDIQEEI